MMNTTTKLYRNLSMAELCRQVYAQRREEARKAGFVGNFVHACIAANGGRTPSTPEEWVEAADGALSTVLGYDITNVCLDDSQIG